MRRLSPEEQLLWERVTSTITPLSRDRPVPVAKPAASAPSQAAVPAKPQALVRVARGRVPPLRPVTEAPKRRATIHGNLDGHWERRLKSGTIAIDRTLDLHELGLDAAWDAIDGALERAVIAGDRVLLLVTGHHRPGEPPVQRGKIRAAVHDWLAVSRHAERIAAVRNAHRSHGGGGSLYLILRR